MTTTTVHDRMAVQISTLLDRHRKAHGDDHHAAICLGTIDGAAESLAAAAGPAQAAEALYRAADEMVRRNLAAPEIRLRREGLFRRAWRSLGRISVFGWWFLAMMVLAAYGCWRAM